MQNVAELDLVNKQTYAREDVLEFYQHANELLAAEKVLFDKLRPFLRDANVLDLGIGGGRTTKFLVEAAGDYTGVDYVKEFADHTALRYPAAKILWGDARDLKHADDATYDFALFSYNGLDSIAHADRLKVLSEVNRVLKPGGIFMFSSHNRDYRYFGKLPWQQRFRFNKGFIIFFLHCLYHLPKHYRMKKFEVFEDDYPIVNDGDHRFSLMLYYISIADQQKQLADHGFSGVEAYDINGRQVTSDNESHWIYYLARKAQS